MTKENIMNFLSSTEAIRVINSDHLRGLEETEIELD